jgi:hypothetical protein
LDLDVRILPVGNFLNEEIIEEHRIGPGDEVFITGLFTKAVGASQNMPIVRMGNVSLMPHEKIPHGDLGLIDAYLIEARSIGGLSGSPVFVSETAQMPSTYADPKKSKPEKLFMLGHGQTFFMGLLRGHWDVPPNRFFHEMEKVNMGISVVVPAHKIREILFHPEQIALREEVENRMLAEGEATPDSA